MNRLRTLYFTIFLIFIYSLTANAQDTNYVSNYFIGETKVSISAVCYNPCRDRVVFINLHENENTSVKAAEEYLFENGGRLVRLQTTGVRNVAFKLNKKTYSFDPNRIYSKAGRQATLAALSGTSDSTAEKSLEEFSNKFLSLYIDNSPLVIALHNNTNDNLSVLSYKNDQAALTNAGLTYVSTVMDPDDFILTTDTTIFNLLKEKNINVVWEDVNVIKDDGSLSVYAALNKIPYINIEAQHDHIEEQRQMLIALKEIIEKYEKAELDD
jgi:hypothetical protein